MAVPSAGGGTDHHTTDLVLNSKIGPVHMGVKAGVVQMTSSITGIPHNAEASSEPQEIHSQPSYMVALLQGSLLHQYPEI